MDIASAWFQNLQLHILQSYWPLEILYALLAIFLQKQMGTSRRRFKSCSQATASSIVMWLFITWSSPSIFRYCIYAEFSLAAQQTWWPCGQSRPGWSPVPNLTSWFIDLIQRSCDCLLSFRTCAKVIFAHSDCASYAYIGSSSGFPWNSAKKFVDWSIVFNRFLMLAQRHLFKNELTKTCSLQHSWHAKF